MTIVNIYMYTSLWVLFLWDTLLDTSLCKDLLLISLEMVLKYGLIALQRNFLIYNSQQEYIRSPIHIPLQILGLVNLKHNFSK